MRISKQLIELVLSGRGNEEDEEVVRAFFREYPEKLAQYLTEASWEGFEGDVRSAVPREKMLEVIEGKVGKMERRAPVRKMRYALAAAAAVVIVVVGASRLLNRSRGAVAIQKPVVSAPVVAAAVAGLRTIENSTLKPQIYSFPDGSQVKLSGRSKISYNSPFINNRRDIYLEGEGFLPSRKIRRGLLRCMRGISSRRHWERCFASAIRAVRSRLSSCIADGW
ncbi:hypothetical protein ACQ86N_07595 [Puia sp. P3]|uniref:hypothetical protein n=1 Tax=Puia sp. P3 TaxID=3423952 RepID=UPI003D679A60